MAEPDKKRSPYDFYPTPRDVVEKLFDHYFLDGVDNETILEPCAGDGVIVEAIKRRYPRAVISAIEIDATHEDALQATEPDFYVLKDFLKLNNAQLNCYDWVITNPPFSLAQEFIEKSLQIAQKGVIMLLRLNFLGSQKRHNFWIKNPPDKIMVLSKRPSFTGNGTDSQEYAWFIWDKKKHERPIEVI